MPNDKTVSITITAKDGTKQAFQAIAQDATTMGEAISRSGANAATALNATNSRAQELLIAMQKVRQDAAVFGQMLGQTVVAGLQAVAAAGVASQRAIDQLAQAVQDAGQNYNDYKTAIEAAAAAGQQYGLSATIVTGALQTLVSVTQDTAASINLIGLAEDIAAAKHMSLASAAQLVGRVYDGNVGILKRYGIVIQSGTTSTEALAILQQRYAGQAEAGATTISRYTAEVTNWAAAAGRAIGPFSGLIQVLPGLSAGFQLAEAGGKLLIDMFRAQQIAADAAAVAIQAETAAAGESALVGEASGAASGAGLLGVFAGPVGIVAALAAAAAGIYLLTRNTTDYRTAVDAAATDTSKLAAAVASLQSGGGAPATVAGLKAVSDEWIALDAAAAKYREELALANQPLGQSVDQNQPMFTGTNTDAYNAPILAARQYVAEMSQLAAISKADEDSITASLSNIFAHPGVDPVKAQTAIDALFQAFKDGKINADGLAQGLSDLNLNWPSLVDNAATASAAVNALNTQVTKLQDSLAKGVLNQAVGGLDTKPIQDVIDAISGGTGDAAKAFQATLGDILNGIADGTFTAANGYKRIIELGGDFTAMLGNQAAAAEAAGTAAGNMTTALNAEAAAYSAAYEAAHDPAARLLAEGMAAQAASVAMYGFADSYEATARARAHLNNVMAEGDAAYALDQQNATMQAESDAIRAANIKKVSDAIAEQTAALAAQGDVSSPLSGGTLTPKETKSTEAATAAVTKFYEDQIAIAQQELEKAGQLPSFLQVVADVQFKHLPPAETLAWPGTRESQQGAGKWPSAGATAAPIDPSWKGVPTQPQPTMGPFQDLINQKGMFLEIHDLYQQGIIDAKEYNAAKLAFSKTGPLTQGDADAIKGLVTQLVNAKGQYGAIDDMLAKGLITQKQYNQAQKDYDQIIAERADPKHLNLEMVAATVDATNSLDDMTRVVIGNTDAIAKNSQSLSDWATKLIGPAGTWAEIDTLLAHGKITLDEYNQAQDAGTRIMADSARVQEDVQTLQAKEAPLLADLADTQANYLDGLAKLPAAQALAALGFMDATESMKAQNLVALAAQAAMGQLGTKGKEAATSIIQGAAEADPALQAMLQAMGLISVGADGTITVDFPTGESVQSAIDGLQTTMNNLVEFEYLLNIGADTSDFWDHVHGLDGQHVGSVYIDVLGVYSAPLLPYQDPNAAGNLPASGSMLGGVIQRHASGGVASWLAEAGPEWLDFPNGGHGMAYTKGVYNVPEGTYVHTAPATKAMGAGGGNHITQNFAPIYIVPTSGNLYETLNQSAIDQHRRG